MTDTTRIDERVQQYITVRDAIKHMDEEHEKKKAPFVTVLKELEGRLSKFLADNKVQHVATANGTCYRSVRYTASLADPEAFMNFVITNQKFDLLDRRANSTAVRDYIESNNAPPPGCNLNAIESVGVRRPTK